MAVATPSQEKSTAESDRKPIDVSPSPLLFPAKGKPLIMPKRNWKSLSLLVGVTSLGGVLLALGALATLSLPLSGWTGLGPFVALLILTVAASRFTVPVTNAMGVAQSQKSVADAFIFLAVMMY